MISIYYIEWSEEDEEYVATCYEYPSLSWLAKEPVEALAGLKAMLDKIESENAGD
jgi:hypothetical protein